MIRCSAVISFILLGTALTSRSDAHPLDPAVVSKDLNFENVKIVRDSAAEAVDPTHLLSAMGLVPAGNGEPLRFRQSEAGSGKSVRVVVPFNTPVELGSVFWTGSFSQIYVLKDQAKPDPKSAASWTQIKIAPNQLGGHLATFPPKLRTLAVMFEDPQAKESSELGTLRFFAARLSNVTPIAQAYADSEYTAYSPFAPPFTYVADRITTGAGEWINTGKNRDGRVPRAGVGSGPFVVSPDLARAAQDRRALVGRQLHVGRSPELRWSRRRQSAQEPTTNGERFVTSSRGPLAEGSRRSSPFRPAAFE